MSTKASAEREEHRAARSVKGRAIPFVWHWLLAASIPVLGRLGWAMGQRDPLVRAELALLVGPLTLALAWLAVRLGQHARRKPIIYWHSASTVLAVGASWGITLVVGWSTGWAVLNGVGAAAFAVSWNLHRIDALRSRPDDKGDDKGWGEVFGVPATKIGRPTVDANDAVHAEIKVGAGETVADVQHALPKIEAAAHALPGRSRVVADPDDAQRAKLVIARRDALRSLPEWEGPSHPGGSIVDPIVTALYEDGSPQQFWFCSGVAPDGEVRAATHIGRMGMTRSGKTHDARLELAEVLSRRDVVLVYADATKGAQSAGPLMPGITLYADSAAKAKLLNAGMRQLVRDRADRLGRFGFTDWSPACFAHPQLRMPAVVYYIDEADELIGTTTFTWLTARALSAGVFLSVALPRADSASMPTTARYSIGAWKCFGVGDDYSAEFALTPPTIAAGAHPENWRQTKPGYHFFDTAPGVDPQMWPVPARSFRYDMARIAEVVAQFAPGRAVLPPEDEASLSTPLTVNGAKAGDAWNHCQPGLARTGTVAVAGSGVPAPVEADDEMDDEMSAVPDGAGEDDEEGGQMPKTWVQVEDGEVEGDAATYGQIDPREPIAPPDPDDDDRQFGDDLPDAPSPEHAAQAFDALLVRLAGQPGRTDFAVGEILEDFPYRSDTWVSRRLTALAEGAVVSPPGLTVQRLSRGRYSIQRLNGGAS